MNGPVLYRQVEVLDDALHRDLRFAPPPDFGFAREVRDCPLLAEEFFDAAKHYPIVFTRTDAGDLAAAAVLGWPGTGNLWLEADGRWKANAYVPAYVRRYPFIVVGTEAGPCIGIDRAYAGWSTSAGEPLFDANGALAKPVLRAAGLLDEYLDAYARTQAFLREIERLNLLQPFSAELALDRPGLRIEQMLCIDRAAVHALSSCALIDFVRTGYYALAVAHHMSLANFNTLADAVS